MKDFEVISHTADLKIRVYAKVFPDLFVNALIGMFQSIVPHVVNGVVNNDRLVCLEMPKHHTITIVAANQESLLVDFLSEALYLSDVHNEAYLDAHIIHLSQTTIQAKLIGVDITGFDVEIKAVTYHDLNIIYADGMWQTDIVFDI